MPPNEGGNSLEQTKIWREMLAENGTSISEVVQFMQAHEKECLECQVGRPKAGDENCSNYQGWLRFIKEYMFKDIPHFKFKVQLRGESLEVMNYLKDKKIEFLESQGKVITSRITDSLDQKTLLEGKVKGAVLKIHQLEGLIESLKGVIKQILPAIESEDITLLMSELIKHYRLIENANKRQTEYMNKKNETIAELEKLRDNDAFQQTLNKARNHVEQALGAWEIFLNSIAVNAQSQNDTIKEKIPAHITFKQMVNVLKNMLGHLEKVEEMLHKKGWGAEKIGYMIQNMLPPEK